ncbi:MAG: hypothetical protein ACTTKL_03495 [Treponema sp.]
MKMRYTYYSSKKIFFYRLLIIMSRTALFLFLFSVMMFVLFIMGNYQNFTDKNLWIVIKTATLSSLSLCTVAFFNVFCSVVFFFIKRRKRYVLTACLMLFASMTGLLMATFLRTIEIISRGIS